MWTRLVPRQRNRERRLPVPRPNDTLQAWGLSNSGTINVNQASSSIDPPFHNNLGTINIAANSTIVVGTGSPTGTGHIQLPNGTLGEMISSTNLGVIDVTGPTSLDGTLDILLQEDFIGGGFDVSIPALHSGAAQRPFREYSERQL